MPWAISLTLRSFFPGVEIRLSNDEYSYRRPRWFLGLLLGFGFTAPVLFALVVAASYHSWWIGVGGTLFLVLEALAIAWVSRKPHIVMDSERMRWPHTGRELRWDDVDSSRIVKVIGFEYARVTTKSGKVKWIALAEPGGRELRRQVLVRLGLGQ